MKPITRLFTLVTAAFAVLAAGNFLVSTASAQATAFTYQGRLDDSSGPVTGLYDFQFHLYSVASGGAAVAGGNDIPLQLVSNGLFTVTLDFLNSFTGTDRWLEIAVRTNGGAAYSTLSPRQKLTATPYAITAGNVSGAVPASQLTGTIAAGRLPASVVTNGASGLNLTGTFSGNGAGITNVSVDTLRQTVDPVVAWGSGNQGQTAIPPGLTGVVAIASGAGHNLAVRTDGTVIAWGWNFGGQSEVPAGLNAVRVVAGGTFHSLALKRDGTVVAWGRNNNGETNVPAGLAGVASIAAGGSHSLARLSNGTMVAWGWNAHGQTNIPAGLGGVLAVAAGEYHSLALKSDGTVAAWGDNTFGGQTDVPAGLNNVKAIAAGSYHNLALRHDGTVVAWGWNSQGQADVPPGLADVVAVSGGAYHSLALKADGTVVVWGGNDSGQTNVPFGLAGVTRIAAGNLHSLVLRGTDAKPQFALLNQDNVFQGSVAARSFSGDGSGLSNLNASALSGTIPPANIGAGTITTTALADGAVTADKVATTSSWFPRTISIPLASQSFGFGGLVAPIGTDVIAVLAELVNAGSGVVHLFTKSGSLLRSFTSPAPGQADAFGSAVAPFGDDSILIAARKAGLVYLFKTNGTLVTEFTNPMPDPTDAFGRSVAAIGNDRVLIPAPHNDTHGFNAGIVYVFSTNGTLQTTITNPAPTVSVWFGWSAGSLGEDRVFIGTLNKGAYLFSTSGALLTTFTNPVSGPTDGFGAAIAAVGSDRIVIGAYGENQSGSAYLFSTNGAVLTIFTNPTPAYLDYFGYSVAAVGNDRVLIGAFGDGATGFGVGVAYLFDTNGALLATFTNPGPQPGDWFGNTVAAVGNDVVIGAPNDDAYGWDRGAVYVFSLTDYTPGLVPAMVAPASITTASLADNSVTLQKLDPSMGIWSRVNDRMFWLDGAVGIGTVAPASKLHVEGDGTSAAIAGYSASVHSALYGENTNTAGYAGYFNGNVRVTGDLAVAGSNVFSGPQLFLGGVSLGTTNPGSPALRISGDINQEGVLYANGVSAASVTTTEVITPRISAPTGAALDIRVNGDRALRIEPNAVSPNIVGGSAGNIISNGVVGGFIGGGGDATYPNRVGGNYASVLGGVNNTASGANSTAMGSDTTARGNHSTAMGRFTIASGSASTAMGFMSTASGFSSMALGNRSVAGGHYSVALGVGAEATHLGSFVWSNPSNTLDSTVVPFSSTAANQFLIRASGGVGIGTSDPQAGLRVSTPGGLNLPQLFLSQTTPGDWSRLRLQSDGPAWDIALGPGPAPVLNFFNGSANILQLRQSGDAWLNRNLSFDTAPGVRQMIDLWNGEHAIGVQNWTTYFRTIGGATPGAFAWFRGGSHTNSQYEAGIGGEELMRLNASGLTVRGTFVSSSDRNVKENFEAVNPREVLEKVAALPLSRWNYKEDQSQQHIGPMAQDFHAAFGVGPDDKHITTVDADGVALAAIQGLNQKLESRSQEAGEKIHQLAAENAALHARIEQLEKLLSKLTLQH